MRLRHLCKNPQCSRDKNVVALGGSNYTSRRAQKAPLECDGLPSLFKTRKEPLDAEPSGGWGIAGCWGTADHEYMVPVCHQSPRYAPANIAYV